MAMTRGHRHSGRNKQHRGILVSFANLFSDQHVNFIAVRFQVFVRSTQLGMVLQVAKAVTFAGYRSTGDKNGPKDDERGFQ